MKEFLRRVACFLLRWLSEKSRSSFFRHGESEYQKYSKSSCDCAEGAASIPPMTKNEEEKIMGKTIAISSGHGRLVRGASGVIDEVDEARRVTDRVAEIIRGAGHTCHIFHDDVSTTQAQNINTIVAWHNRNRDAHHVSVHFNAVEGRTANPIGTEVVVHPNAGEAVRRLASNVAQGMAKAGGLRLRRPGPHPGVLDLNVGVTRNISGFVEGCGHGSMLLEVCFVNSQADADLYNRNFEAVCAAIADALTA